MKPFLAAVLSLALAACVTVTNTLSPDQVASFGLAGVVVDVPDDSNVRWGDGEAAYAVSRGVAPHDAGQLSATPEARVHLRQSVAGKLKGAFEREFGQQLTGTRPVRVEIVVRRLEIVVRRLEISPVIQRILIGGNHYVHADVNVVDARTGAVLLRFPDQTVASAAGEGLLGSMVDAALFDAPIDRVTANYASTYRRWLLKA